MRKFEKISFDQFKKDCSDDLDSYNSYKIPSRKTLNSAGYDFELLEDITLKPNEVKKIPTGIKVSLDDLDFLMLVVRSSIGFKYNIRLTNQIGIIDKDYYNNSSNEGHIFISVQNEGTDTVSFHKHSSLCQGIIMKYHITSNDINTNTIRIGGIGSTNKEEN